LILVTGWRSSPLHDGWPLKFFDYTTKNTVESMAGSHVNPSIRWSFSQMFLQDEWNVYLRQHPVMKCLDKATWVFKVAERLDPPRLLSDKFIQMREIEKYEQRTT
jgi:hypothetical protein